MNPIWLAPFVATTAVFLVGGLPWPAALVNAVIWGTVAFVGIWALRHEQGVRRVRAESAHDLDRGRAEATPTDHAIRRSE